MSTVTSGFWLRFQLLGGFAPLLLAIAAMDAVAQQGERLVPIVQQEVDSNPQAHQQAQPSQSAWTKLCDKVAEASQASAEGEPAAKKVNLCITLQERLNNTDGSLVFSASVRQQEGADQVYLMAIVPIGLDLKAEVQAKIDKGKPMQLDYIRCDKVGCVAEAPLPAAMLQTMKSGQQLVIEPKGPRGRTISFVMPLAGFTAAYEGAPADAKKYHEARQEVVRQIRIRRQEQIRKAVQELDKRQQPDAPQQPQP
jgi:invasion protein IalB